ncbi:Rha family transcriptional regulator [Burkholderia cepacia]|uniref:Rha family transcriptional regulator n=1 Tax=Burkholderia cepacia TaxID=292 RepID=UPI001CF4C42C|nr:phage regulatory protein/antirepressor Ant [Burkholderia cepacia]MCA8080868.1 phage regulatory protein/antirepressor Ant [Burkholderia cepacia]
MATTQKQKGRDSGKSATQTTRADDSALPALVHLRDGAPMADSVAIAQAFGRAHKNVLASLDSLIADDTINGLEFKPVEYRDAKGERRRAIELTERGALIAMPFIGGTRAREGQVRLVDAFMRMREQLAARPQHAAGASMVPQSLPEALRLAADLAEANSRLEHTIERQAQKVAALDRLATASGSMCPTDAAKMLKVSPRELIAWLDRNSWTYRRGGGAQIAYQALIMRGLLAHASRTIQLQDGTDKVVSSVRVTPKGLTELARIAASGAFAVAREGR